MTATADYEIEIRVRNHRLLAKMREMGFPTAKSLAEAAKVQYSQICEYLRFALPPMRDRNGKQEPRWSPAILRLATTLKCLPEDLFPSQHFLTPLAKSRASFVIDASTIGNLIASPTSPDDNLIEQDIDEALSDSLAHLPPRERHVLIHRFGLNGSPPKTLDETAAITPRADGNPGPLSREVIRQLEQKALRHLRHPSFTRMILKSGYVPPQSDNPPRVRFAKPIVFEPPPRLTAKARQSAPKSAKPRQSAPKTPPKSAKPRQTLPYDDMPYRPAQPPSPIDRGPPMAMPPPPYEPWEEALIAQALEHIRTHGSAVARAHVAGVIKARAAAGLGLLTSTAISAPAPPDA